MTPLVLSCVLYLGSQMSLAAEGRGSFIAEPELAPFAEGLRTAVLAHDVTGIVKLMAPAGLDCRSAQTPLAATEAELNAPGTFWHSFFFDTRTLNAKYSEAGEKRVSLEELFRNGKSLEVRRQEDRVEFVSDNYDIYPKLYLRRLPQGWVIACDLRCEC